MYPKSGDRIVICLIDNYEYDAIYHEMNNNGIYCTLNNKLNFFPYASMLRIEFKGE